jgi:hypothetical protein
MPKFLNTNGVDVHEVLTYNALELKNTDDFRQMLEWNRKILPKYLKSGRLKKTWSLSVVESTFGRRLSRV